MIEEENISYATKQIEEAIGTATDKIQQDLGGLANNIGGSNGVLHNLQLIHELLGPIHGLLRGAQFALFAILAIEIYKTFVA